MEPPVDLDGYLSLRLDALLADVPALSLGTRPERERVLDELAEVHHGAAWSGDGAAPKLSSPLADVRSLRSLSPDRLTERGATRRSVVSAAVRAIEERLRGRVPGRPEVYRALALIEPELRPVFDVRGGDFSPTRTWAWLDGSRPALRPCIAGVGRLRADGLPYENLAGTGFLVGPGLLLTNRHVALRFGSGFGGAPLEVDFERHPDCDLLQERGRDERRILRVEGLRMVHPYWDVAIVEVSGDALASLTPLVLRARPVPEAERVGHAVVVVGYPVKEYIADAQLREHRDLLFDDTFNVKRCQPGKITRHARAGMSIPGSSERRPTPVVGHDCSTLAGNSGSAVIDHATGEVWGVHYGGDHGVANYAVPAWELARDPRVRALGVRFSGEPEAPPDPEVERAWAG